MKREDVFNVIKQAKSAQKNNENNNNDIDKILEKKTIEELLEIKKQLGYSNEPEEKAKRI